MNNSNYPAKIKMEDGEWIFCQISYPHQESPIKVAGPLGTTQWEKSPFSRFNAKITLNVHSTILAPGKYEIHFGGKERIFEAKNPKINTVWGDVL